MFVHPSRRYRLYIDETGTQTMKRAHEDRFLCLMGLVMLQAAHDGPVTERLSRIKADLFGHCPQKPVILHRREMVRGESPFEALKTDPLLAILWERRWAEFVGRVPFIAMAGAIDKDEHVRKYVVWQHDPYHYCLEILLERYVKWLDRHSFVGDVLIESRDKHADKRLKKAYKRFYSLGNQHVRPEVAQARLTTGEVKFGHKRDDVAGHQLADSLAHPVLRHMKTVHLGLPAAEGYGAELVDILRAEKLARKPGTDLIEGWGLKWLP